jgi:hypothetical protein
LTHRGPAGVGWDWRYRVTSLDGRAQAQWIDGYAPSDDQAATMSVEGQFASLRDRIAGSGELRMTFDPDLGYPTEVSSGDVRIADSDSTDTITDFVSGTEARVASVREMLRSARTAWKRWEPTAYEFVWRRFGAAAGPASGTTWHVEHSDGSTATGADPGSDGASPADKASVRSTFDAVAEALDAGAWVDLTVAPTSGVPTLVAVDPSPTQTGDGFWIRIAFRDVAREAAMSAAVAAWDRWAAAGLQHFSYTWRYRGEYAPLTYGMTLNGDVATLRRSPGTPGPEASAFATPRIDDTFRMIQTVLAQGGRVNATYDPVLGYPIRVEVDPAGDAGPRGTVTITSFDTP